MYEVKWGKGQIQNRSRACSVVQYHLLLQYGKKREQSNNH